MRHLPYKQWLSFVTFILLLYALWASSQDRLSTPSSLSRERENTVANTVKSSEDSSSASEGPTIPKAPFTNSDISMVFQIISDATGWSIFPSPEVAKATVTIYANDISAEALLDHVVSVAGFVYHREGNIITVMTFKEYERTYEVEKEIIHLEFADAASVGKVIQPFLTDLGKHVVHKETNTVVLYEVPANLMPISAIIRKLDTPAVSTQVEIVNLKYADSDEVAKILNQVYKPSETRQVNRTEPSKTIQGPIQDTEADSDTLPQDQIGIFAVVHANQLVIVGIEEDVQRILDLLQEIDVAGENLKLEVIPLKYADAAMVEQTIEEVFGEKTAGSGRITAPRTPQRTTSTNTPSNSLASIGLYTQIDVIAIERTNQIIIKAFSADMERALKLVEQLDVFAEPTTQTYHFSYADASQVFEGLDRILGLYQGYSQASSRSGSTQIASQTSHSEFGVTLIERTNSVLLTGPPSAHRIMQSICDRVDVPGLYDSGIIQIYQIQNANVDEIAETITTLLDVSSDKDTTANTSARFTDNSSTTTMPDHPTSDTQRSEDFLPRVEPKISINAATNSIIVKASERDHAEIEKVIAKLDVIRKQVIVKAMIVELSRTDDSDLGIELDSIDGKEKAFTSFGLSTFDFISGSRTSFGGTGGTLAILDPGKVQAIIRASQQNDNIHIQSAPQILVTNNTEGSINSVAEEPTSQTHQGETTTTTSFNEYVEAGTVFKVTPQITKGDYLHMDYQINLSSFGQKADSSLPPSRSKSEMISSTTVPDGYTIVLGGIQTTHESKSINKVPILGDIPLIGLLFRNTVIRKKYITTYLFVTASIMKAEDFSDLRNRSSDALQEVNDKQNQEP